MNPGKKSLILEKKKIFILCVFFIIGTILTGISILTYQTSFSVLAYEHTTDYEIKPQEIILYSGQAIRGKIIAKENNLGAIAVRIHNFNVGNVEVSKEPMEEDRIIFRMKEEGSEKWYYEQSYSGGQFHELEMFPFGFPTVADSKGKAYTFEIVSRKGNASNALTLYNNGPLIVSQYQFNKQTLLSSNNDFAYFVFQKFVYGQKKIELLFIITINYLPFFYALYWKKISNFVGKSFIARGMRLMIKKYLFKYDSFKTMSILRPFLPTFEKVTVYELVIILAIFVDIFFLQQKYIFIIVVLLSLWIYRLVIYPYAFRNTFIAVLIFLLFCPILLQFDYNRLFAEKASFWALMFLVSGTIAVFFEGKSYSKIFVKRKN